MSTISSLGGAGSAWSDLTSSRAGARKEKASANAAGSGKAMDGSSGLQGMFRRRAVEAGSTGDMASDPATSTASPGARTTARAESAAPAKSLLPPPASTVDFAQQRSGADSMFSSLDTDGNGSVSSSELNKLLDQIAASIPGATEGAATVASAAGATAASTGTGTGTGTDTSTSADSAVASAEADIFNQLDTNGDGAVSKSEFDAAMAGPTGGSEHVHRHGGMPPPPPLDSTDGTDDSSASGASGTDLASIAGSSTLSATDLATGQFNDLVNSLGSALENSGAGGLSASQADAFKSQFDAAIASMTSAASSGGSGGSTNGGDSSSSAYAPPQMPDLSALADLVMKQYGQVAASQPQGSSYSFSA